VALTNISDIHRLDRELDHLRSLDLISQYSGGFSPSSKELDADISPSSLALNLFVRSQGYRGDISIFWKDSLTTREQIQKEKTEKANKQRDSLIIEDG